MSTPADPGSPPLVTVLIVDDHEMLAQALSDVIEREPDLRVVGRAASAALALSLVREHEPDVVLMDYRLGGEDGVTATRKIRAERPETRVVMLTSVMTEAVLVSAMEAGCAGFVTKDRAVEDVLDAVRTAASGGAAISAQLLAQLVSGRQAGRGVGEDLTPRELEVLRLLGRGWSNQAIADELVLSLKTVRNHVQSVLVKLGAHSKLEAVAVAARRGLIELEA